MIRNLMTLWLVLASGCSETVSGSDELVGLWEGKRIAGPVVQGDLWITHTDGRWLADVAGRTIEVAHDSGELTFAVPGGYGSFRGKVASDGPRIIGHWTQPGILNNGMPHASPVILRQIDENRWRGNIHPLIDEFTVYLAVREREGLPPKAFFRNPDRGFGVWFNVDRVELQGETVQWIGQWFRNADERVLMEAAYQPGQMTVNIRGNIYDLRRLEDDAHSHFYARGKRPGPYHYRPPQFIPEDGWDVGTLEQAAIDEKAIGRFVDEVLLPSAVSIDDPYVHGFLIARSGKLVLEEYFHGFHRNKAHDTRSASKSLAAVLAGAVIHSGAHLTEDSLAFDILAGPELGRDDARNRIALRHLVSMSSGLDCDDGDSSSPGNEDTMQSQSDEPDWYRYTMNLSSIREPGEKAVYCTAGMNLVGAVLAAATGRTLEDLFQEYIAGPLQIEHYYLNLSPTGHPYMGGGIYWEPRDFMKLGQLMLNGGTWKDQRILSEDYAEKSISTLYTMNNKGYGYGWWTIDYPYNDRHVSAFFAAGNGGQIVMGIPELDLLIAFFAGNYSHPTMFRIQEEFVPRYILPAILKAAP